MNIPVRSLNNRISLTVLFTGLAVLLSAQKWKPAMEGVLSNQPGIYGIAFHIEFKPNGPLGKDWIYGGYLDEDSLRRCVAYREGGRWVPLPFHGYYANRAYDIEMFGDTMYIGGRFTRLILDKDSSSLPNTSLLKWFNDSLWADTIGKIFNPVDMSVKGDSLLIWGASYYDPPDNIIYTQYMTPNGGESWQYPYSVVHPTESSSDFGAQLHLEILENGDILTINNGSPPGNPFRGISRWDGEQWHSYGKGLQGSYSRTFDFEFYRGELYMGGTFKKDNNSKEPGNFVARWDGSEWQGLANGTTGFVRDLFTYKDVLYCSVDGGGYSHSFGDATIPFMAGWDGEKWCGIPFEYDSPPSTYGFVNDTLFVTFYEPGTANGDPVSYINYLDGDYLHGPDAVCSTPGIGMEEVSVKETSLSVYPNPVNEVLTIHLANDEEIQKIELYDLTGNCIRKTDDLFTHSNENKADVNISKLIPGVYFLKVNNEYTRKILKL